MISTKPAERARKEDTPRDVVLIFRTGQLGDTILALPAIHAIRVRHPASQIVLLTDRHPDSGFVSSWDVVAPTGWVDAVEYYQPGSGWRAILSNAVALMGRLRSLAPRAVYALPPNRSLAQYIRDCSFFRFTLRNAEHHFLRPPSLMPYRLFGQVRRAEPEWKRLLAVPGGSARTDEFSMPASLAGESEARLACELAGLSRQRHWLAIAPGSKMPAKVWPAERYAAVGQMLAENHDDLDLVIVGGKEDASCGAELCAGWNGRGYNLAGKLSIHGSAAVLRRCAGYLGNDTGTMHLAAAVGVRCVALFSARDRPGKWDPFGPGHIVIRREVECAGCMLEICSAKRNKCLTLIPVEEVYQAVNRLLVER